MELNAKQFSRVLLRWYDQHGRSNLPWRQNISPYRVWVSEIMLQQTQVATVIPYFNKFMDCFPSIQALADASLDEVLEHWSGLGYYARARNLHQTAKIITQQFDARFPSELEELQTLPGIGRSTAGAIRAIAFQQPAPILDGNVKRVFTRLYAIAGWPNESSIAKQLWDIATNLLPNSRYDDYTQSLMDLGAMVCTRSEPKCQGCPLVGFCLGHLSGQEKLLPTPKPQKQLPVKKVFLLLLSDGSHNILLERRPPVGIWGGLWSLPECASDTDITEWCAKHYQYQVKKLQHLPSFRHTFSHFHLDLTPVKLIVAPSNDRIMESSDRVWYKLNQPLSYGVPAPIKRLLIKLSGENS